uniref:Uncharacterized protein n=1 Tax=Cacopsylla melanoneura TaxID=428564 RepID=A0A8D9BXT0_9HEMI
MPFQSQKKISQTNYSNLISSRYLQNIKVGNQILNETSLTPPVLFRIFSPSVLCLFACAFNKLLNYSVPESYLGLATLAFVLWNDVLGVCLVFLIELGIIKYTISLFLSDNDFFIGNFLPKVLD